MKRPNYRKPKLCDCGKPSQRDSIFCKDCYREVIEGNEERGLKWIPELPKGGEDMSKLDEIVNKHIGKCTPNLQQDTLNAMDSLIEALKGEICSGCQYGSECDHKNDCETIGITSIDFAYKNLKENK